MSRTTMQEARSLAGALPLVATALAATVLGATTDVAAQMCTTSLLPTGGTLVVLRDNVSTRWSTLGVERRFDDRWWGGLTVGGTTMDQKLITVGADANGDYVGDYRGKFIGVRGAGGWSGTAGGFTVCANARATYSREYAADLTKYYRNSLGQTIATEEVSLGGPFATEQRGELELAGDYALSERTAIGMGLVAGRSSRRYPEASTVAYTEVGIGLGFGAVVWRGLRIEARYDDPLWDDAGSSTRDGWFTLGVGWMF